MKHIRLKVAQRYLQRYADVCYAREEVHIECIDTTGKTPKCTNALMLLKGRTARIARYTPTTKVYLKRRGSPIAEITVGLPEVTGFFEATTGEFTQEIPY
ncbi:MAG: hypothetical protein OXH00_21550 [Candidatus Poribacteria bacterium]|nr:hypothetical protein [Candidatus Poribacteria bacterium]